MKIFKTMAAAALLLVGTVAMAQGQGNRPMRSATERAKNETERVVKALELNVEQTGKIQVINYKYAVKDSIRFAERQNNAEKPDRETMMKIRKEEGAAKATEVKALLTDDQKAKYDAILKERENRGPRQGGNGNRPEGAPDGAPEGGK